MIKEEVWIEVKKLRNEGLSQKATAKLLGISVRSIVNHYKGDKRYVFKPNLPKWYLNMIGGETKIRVDKQGRMPWQNPSRIEEVLKHISID